MPTASRMRAKAGNLNSTPAVGADQPHPGKEVAGDARVCRPHATQTQRQRYRTQKQRHRDNDSAKMATSKASGLCSARPPSTAVTR